jgi:hypothetical protein
VTVLAATLLQEGCVRVPGALDPAFCESVVDEVLTHAGVDASDRAAWPTGTLHLPVRRNWRLETIAPAANEVLLDLAGPNDRISFAGVQDNLIVNFPSAGTSAFAPADWSDGDGWHKDGDWFRHFLDSPEQALLVIVFWDDVGEAQGPTHVAVDSISPIARHLAEHPEGLDPADLKPVVAEILPTCSDFRALTGRRGDIVFAHPFLLHRASVNSTDDLRLISNSSVMLREPMRFDRPDGAHSAVERSILGALGVDRLAFRPTAERRTLVPERQRRWDELDDDAAR